MPKIFRLLMVAAAIVLGAFYFVHWSKTRALNSGEVHIRRQANDKAKTGVPATASTTQPDAATQPAQPQEVASNSDSPGPAGAQTQSGISALPASETISRNPPNGIAAAGSGKFQLYRQGDMTFRLNTETGQACVLFATDAQWRKTVVYEHGCGSH